MLTEIMLLCAIGFVISLAGSDAIRRWGGRWGLVDKPGHRKIHEVPMPTCGGLAIWAGIVLPLGGLVLASWVMVDQGELAAWARRLPLPEAVASHLPGVAWQSGPLVALLVGATVMMLVGLVDDRRGLPWQWRLGAQLGVAVVMVSLGWRMSLFIDAPWLTWPLSVLWIAGLVNSFNMLDNMDGLSGGVGLVAAVLLGLVLLLTPNPQSHEPQLFLGGFLFLVAASLLGFLWHNRPPARLFMGDAGSYLIGFLLATTTLAATFAGEDTPPHAVLAPLCVMAVPFYDTLTVVVIRLRRGKSPFEGDKNHFSHRLVELGLTKGQSVGTILLTTVTCGLGALLLHQIDAFGAIVVFFLVASVLTLIHILESAPRNRDRRGGE